MALLSEQGAADPDWSKHLPQPQWFQATAGLGTVGALIKFLEENSMALGSETRAVLCELHEYQRVLGKTALYRLRWHLAVSWL